MRSCSLAQSSEYQKSYNLSWVAKEKYNLGNGYPTWTEKKTRRNLNSELGESKSGQTNDSENSLKSNHAQLVSLGSEGVFHSDLAD